MNSWNLDPVFLKLFPWTTDFNPNNIKQSSTQFWELRYKILVARKGFAFFVVLEFKNLPSLCNHCKTIGHFVEVFKKVVKYDLIHDLEGWNKADKKVYKPKQTFIQFADKNLMKGKDQIISSEACLNSSYRLEKLVELGRMKAWFSWKRNKIL
ncbi:unnamed protein product [Lathyrus sativus]|nr:unnamed protein product [Lathyrus sativus]